MNYLTTGEMAKYCQVTKRTLWLYHEKGLLSPTYIDTETGYYYYDPQQRQLDTILHLKSLGLTLGQIRELLQASEPDRLNALIQEHIRNLEKELQQIQTSLFSAHLLLGPVSFLKQDPNADKVKLEYMPHCKYLRLNATCNAEYPYFDPDDCWTNRLHNMRLYLEKKEFRSLLTTWAMFSGRQNPAAMIWSAQISRPISMNLLQWGTVHRYRMDTI